MLIKGFHSVWINIKIDNHKRFRLFLPISLYTFWELLDCVTDLLSLACLFVPSRLKANMHKPAYIHTVKELAKLIMDFLSSVTEDGPYELVDVSHENVRVSIKIR